MPTAHLFINQRPPVQRNW